MSTSSAANPIAGSGRGQRGGVVRTEGAGAMGAWPEMGAWPTKDVTNEGGVVRTEGAGPVGGAWPEMGAGPTKGVVGNGAGPTRGR